MCRFYIGILLIILQLSNVSCFTSREICGGSAFVTARSVDRYFLSPVLPEGYNSDLDCVWSITAQTESYTVLIFVLQSSLRPGSCRYENITVYEGLVPDQGKVIQTWCGQSRPTIQSTGPSVTVRFRRKNSRNPFNFKWVYKQNKEQRACNGDLTADSTVRYLTSPEYPNDYRDNLECRWTITTHLANIMFDVVDANFPATAGTCNRDFVKLLDLLNNQALGTICNDQKRVFVSPGNRVQVRFRSDSFYNARGFKMSYQAGNFPSYNQTCGVSKFTIFEDLQTVVLMSPRYPNNYENNLRCYWEIHSPLQVTYNVKVVSSRLASQETSCEDDYVIVYDGSTTSSPFIGKFCGNQTPRYATTGNRVLIYFHTDEHTVDQGFYIEVTSGREMTACEATEDLYASTGKRYLYSPNYPNAYQKNLECSWRIITYVDYVVKLELEAMDVGLDTRPCDRRQGDFVQVFDGSNVQSPSLVVWCGRYLSTGGSVYSTGIHMLVTFHSNNIGHTSQAFFKLSYWTEYRTLASSKGLSPSGVVGVVLTSVVIGIVCFTVVVVVCVKRRNRGQNASPSVNQQNIFFINSEGGNMEQLQVNLNAPPSYNEVVENSPQNSQSCPPPSYQSVLTKGSNQHDPSPGYSEDVEPPSYDDHSVNLNRDINITSQQYAYDNPAAETSET